jgi:hypothetical protein
MTVVKQFFFVVRVIATSLWRQKEIRINRNDTTAVAMDTTVVVETPNIVGVAAGNADFSTLVTASSALSSEGPFTVLPKQCSISQNYQLEQ